MSKLLKLKDASKICVKVFNMLLIYTVNVNMNLFLKVLTK